MALDFNNIKMGERYFRGYENGRPVFTSCADEMIIKGVNNMRDAVVLPYNDAIREIKIMKALDFACFCGATPEPIN